jgi:hypothetical protein
LGKEGYAVVQEVSAASEMKRQTIAAQPSTIVPMEGLLQSSHFIGGCDIYNLYCYKWSASTKTNSEREDFLDHNPSKIDGFVPFVAAYFSYLIDPAPTLDYYSNDEIYIPVSLVNLLQGGIYA